MDVKVKIAAIISEGKAVPLVNVPVDTVMPEEIVKERTANAKVFDAGNGKRTARVYGIPIHYNDGQGFKAIDTTVKRKPLADAKQQYKYEAKTGTYHAHFDELKPWNYRMELGASWIQYTALFEESASLSIAVETTKTGVKETITLKDDKAPTRLQWAVTRSGSGIVTPPPTAIDSNGKDVPVAVTLSKGTLTYDVDVTGAVFPIEIDPTSVTVSNAGTVRNMGATYSTVRDAATGDDVDTSSFYVGQAYSSPNRFVWRAFMAFAIPNMVSLSACSLFLDGLEDQSATNFDVIGCIATHSNPLVLADFDAFSGHQTGGTDTGTPLFAMNTSAYSADWNEIASLPAGRTEVYNARAGTLKLVLLSSTDYNNTAPTDISYVAFNIAGAYLSITYTAPVSALNIMKSHIIGRGISY